MTRLPPASSHPPHAAQLNPIGFNHSYAAVLKAGLDTLYPTKAEARDADEPAWLAR